MNKYEILEWLKKYNVNSNRCRYIINDDMTIDVVGNVKLTKMPNNKITDGIKFNTVSGVFSCYSIDLISLEGCPKDVRGDFYCYSNKLTSLKGGPEEVGGTFYCNINELTTLEGGPEKIGGSFICNNNKLTSLEGGPKKVRGDFKCHDNKLVNLKYMPVVHRNWSTDFNDKEVKVIQDIMKEAKTYEEGVQAYQDYLDIFGDE